MAEKNRRLLDAGTGVFVVDRTILDPLSFAEDSSSESIRTKAEMLLSEVRPGQIGDRIVDGHVIFLCGDNGAFVRRLKVREGNWDVPKLNALEKRLKRLFPPDHCGVSIIDVTRRSPDAVAREIARLVYIEVSYNPMVMEQRLRAALDSQL